MVNLRVYSNVEIYVHRHSYFDFFSEAAQGLESTDSFWIGALCFDQNYIEQVLQAYKISFAGHS